MDKPQFGYWEISIEKYGRIKLPAGLLKLLPEEDRKFFHFTPGFGRYIMLWTESEYKKQTDFLSVLDPDDENAVLYRNVFLRGSGSSDVDSQDRIVISKKLIDYYGIFKDAVVILANGRIELWNAEVYSQQFSMDPKEFSKLNQEIRSTQNNKSTNTEVSYDIS